MEQDRRLGSNRSCAPSEVEQDCDRPSGMPGPAERSHQTVTPCNGRRIEGWPIVGRELLVLAVGRQVGSQGVEGVAIAPEERRRVSAKSVVESLEVRLRGQALRRESTGGGAEGDNKGWEEAPFHEVLLVLRPNALRLCRGGLRQPPPSRQTYPAAGSRTEAPGSPPQAPPPEWGSTQGRPSAFRHSTNARAPAYSVTTTLIPRLRREIDDVSPLDDSGVRL